MIRLRILKQNFLLSTDMQKDLIDRTFYSRDLPQQGKALCGVIFLLSILLPIYFYQGGFANQNTRLNQTVSMIYEGTMSIDSWHTNTVDKAMFQGHFYSEKAPLLSYLAVPSTYLLSLVVDKDSFMHSETLSNLALYLGTITTVGVICGLGFVCLFWIFLFLSPGNLKVATIFLMMVASILATPLSVYSTMMLGHSAAAGLLLIGFFSLLVTNIRAIHPIAHMLGWGMGGFFLGLAVFCEFPVAGMAVGLFLSAVAQDQQLRLNNKLLFKKKILCAAVLGAVPGIFLCLHNYLQFGKPFQMGYGQLGQTIFGNTMNTGLFGVRWPSLSTATQLLAGDYRGLFFYAPGIILAIPGIFRLMNRLKWMIPAFVGCLSLFLINASYGFWQGGVCFGPRHLVPMIPFLCLGWLELPRTHSIKLLFGGITFIGILINLMGYSITPFLSETNLHPLKTYAHLFVEQSLSINPLSFITPVDAASFRWNSLAEFSLASWNLGELAGLSGYASLLPFLIFMFLLINWGLTLAEK